MKTKYQSEMLTSLFFSMHYTSPKSPDQMQSGHPIQKNENALPPNTECQLFASKLDSTQFYLQIFQAHTSHCPLYMICVVQVH